MKKERKKERKREIEEKRKEKKKKKRKPIFMIITNKKINQNTSSNI